MSVQNSSLAQNLRTMGLSDRILLTGNYACQAIYNLLIICIIIMKYHWSAMRAERRIVSKDMKCVLVSHHWHWFLVCDLLLTRWGFYISNLDKAFSRQREINTASSTHRLQCWFSHSWLCFDYGVSSRIRWESKCDNPCLPFIPKHVRQWCKLRIWNRFGGGFSR